MMCGSCGKEITECEVCGGMVCEIGCPDREDDGCTCDGEAIDEDAAEDVDE
jgi:hypothetical protein